MTVTGTTMPDVRKSLAREDEVMATAARADQSNIWWVFLLEGIAALIFGALLLTNPAATLVALSIFLGFYLLFIGVLELVRVFVDRSQMSMIRALRDWGFKPIALPFLNFAPFGGSFHCATLDVRRRGGPESYF